MAHILQITLPNEESQYYKLRSFPIIVGRSTQADITVGHQALSRKHATIKQNGAGDLLIEDLGSSNGTFINKKQILSSQQEIFTTFFPVHLGSDVELRLVNEGDIPEGQRAKVAVVGSSSDHSPNNEPITHLASRSESVSLELAKNSRKIKTSQTGRRAGNVISVKPKSSGGIFNALVLIILASVIAYLYVTS